MISFVLLSLAVVAMSGAEPPLARGVYLVAAPLPLQASPRADLSKATDEVMAQLKQVDGADSGEYHVYLPDGRLQKVTYTTAPLAGASAAESTEQLSQYRHKPAFPGNQLSFQNNQQVNHQFVTGSNQQNSQSNQVKGRLVSEEASAQPEVQQPAKYIASISYSDVQPITGPIYAHSDQPLTRILRYAPVFA